MRRLPELPERPPRPFGALVAGGCIAGVLLGASCAGAVAARVVRVLLWVAS